MESWKGGLRNQDQMALLASVTIFERVAAIFLLIGAGLGLYYSWEKSLAGVIGVLAGLVFGLIGTAWGDYSDPMGGPEPPETDD